MKARNGVTIDVPDYLSQVVKATEGVDPTSFPKLVELILDCYRNGKFVYIIGNGGSGANASHLCEDMGKVTLIDLEKQKRLKVMSLTDNTPYILALGNDEGYEKIFVEQLKNYASPGDLLIAISGSGNSPNIFRAVEYANDLGMATYGFTGYTGGKLKEISQFGLHVPSMDMGIAETVHTIFMHYIIDVMRERFREEHLKSEE
jgi:D-sedoheptulose 7-phosphate isomerase